MKIIFYLNLKNLDQIKVFINFKNVNPNDLIDAKPVDLIEPTKKKSNWIKICTSIGLLIIAISSFRIVKNQHN